MPQIFEALARGSSALPLLREGEEQPAERQGGNDLGDLGDLGGDSQPRALIS